MSRVGIKKKLPLMSKQQTKSFRKTNKCLSKQERHIHVNNSLIHGILLLALCITTLCSIMCNYFKERNVTLEEILPTKLFEVLERSGICTPKQLMVLSIWDIKKLTNLSTEDINFLKTTVSNNFIPSCTSCNILLKQEHKNKKVSTGCKILDDALKGGFRRGTITEIYGESGSGKTQIAIQTVAHNWTEGSVYICTEDMFPVKRYEQIKKNLPDYNASIDYGKNTYIEHITESIDLLSCVRIRLPKLLSKNKLSLIVIDSVAAPFRVESTNYVQRAEELRELAVSLIRVAQEHNIAVLCLNQVTSAFDQAVQVLPSLGLAWSNLVNTRLWLKKLNQIYSLPSESTTEVDLNLFIRELSVEFSPDLPYTVAKCVITPSGVKGI